MSGLFNKLNKINLIFFHIVRLIRKPKITKSKRPSLSNLFKLIKESSYLSIKKLRRPHFEASFF